MIHPICWIVQRIRKHIATQYALTGACEGVGVDEAADCGVVIAGLQVVKAGLGVTVISTIAQRVSSANTRGGCGKDFAPCIVIVGSCDLTVPVDDGKDIAHQVGTVEVLRAVIVQSIGIAAAVVNEVQSGIAIALPDQLATGIDIGMLNVPALTKP